MRGSKVAVLAGLAAAVAMAASGPAHDSPRPDSRVPSSAVPGSAVPGPAVPPSQVRHPQGSGTRGLAFAVGFDERTDAGLFLEVQAEVAEILEPLQLDPQWYGLAEASGRSFDQPLLVVRFRGACSLSAPLPAIPYRGALGAAHASDGDVLPFIDIHCDRVRALLGPDLRSAFGTLYLARAVARVLSHEVYHVLARTRDHGRTGVAKPTLTSAELTRGRLGFDAIALARLTKRLVPHLSMD